mmetsp:Transcript_7472/g.6761  ORF Transcript_7472/g.6761 Transcript_7472/m.6761 type:complete len:402 (-) Transcript_7472:1146-2351(-)
MASPSVCTEDCGDGIRHSLGPDCDDGNLFVNDGCDANCASENGWFCNGGNVDRPDVCEEVCGDNMDLHWHPCDDGNSLDLDGCTGYCHVEQGYTCANGINNVNDNCWPVCGDGFVVTTEECDIGTGLLKTATSAPGCVGCVITAGWECWNSSPYTESHCYEICGDGCAFGLFACDTGIPAGQGCNDYCQIEVGFYLAANGNGIPCVADTVLEICGDGHDFYQYPCDDGNLINGDGCDAACNIEAGWDCGYGTPEISDICWPLFVPYITDGSISSDNSVALALLNVTVLTSPLTSMDDFTLKLYGPREPRWYPMRYVWSNQYQLQNLVGLDWFSFEPDYSDPIIQLFGDGAETMDLTFEDKTKVFNSIYQDPDHTLINNYVFLGYINSPRESSYRCGMEWWW